MYFRPLPSWTFTVTLKTLPSLLTVCAVSSYKFLHWFPGLDCQSSVSTEAGLPFFSLMEQTDHILSHMPEEIFVLHIPHAPKKFCFLWKFGCLPFYMHFFKGSLLKVSLRHCSLYPILTTGLHHFSVFLICLMVHITGTQRLDQQHINLTQTPFHLFVDV